MSDSLVSSTSLASPSGEDSDLVVVKIGQSVISTDRKERIVTFSLGSCIGVVLYDPVKRAAGMIHCLLPVSRSDQARAAEHPDLFVDTGLTALIEGMFRRGCDRANLIAFLAGAASVMNDRGVFRIGDRNLAVATKLLEKNSITIQAQSVGGTNARTLIVDVATGETRVRVGRQEVTL